ncbi:MAG: hypothetical protein ACSLFB_12450 [Acidimicrobiales bacterium]
MAAEDGKIAGVITKVVSPSGVDSVYGMLKLDRGTDELLHSLRGEVLPGEISELLPQAHNR